MICVTVAKTIKFNLGNEGWSFFAYNSGKKIQMNLTLSIVFFMMPIMINLARS